MVSAKDGMVSSIEELKRGCPNLESFAKVHTPLSGVLTYFDGISSCVTKHADSEGNGLRNRNLRNLLKGNAFDKLSIHLHEFNYIN